MRPALVPAAVLVVLATAACGDDVRSKNDRPDISVPAMAQQQVAFRHEQGAAAPAASTNPQAPASTYWAAQKLIRTADMQIQVGDVAAALKATDSIARTNESLVADSRTTQDADGKKTASVVVRVPTARFSGVVQALRVLGAVKQEDVGTQDVTKEYADLETRLAVKEQTVTRLRGLLDSHSAKLSDVLDVERELSRAVTELEQMKGERRYYDQQIELSTVKLVLFERTPSRMTQIAGPISSAFHNSLDVLGNSVGLMIYLVVAIAPWIVIAVGTVWGLTRLRRRLINGSPASP